MGDLDIDVSGLKAPSIAKLMQAAGAGTQGLGVSAEEAVKAFSAMADMLEKTGGVKRHQEIRESLLVAMRNARRDGPSTWVRLDNDVKKQAAQGIKDAAPDVIEIALIRGEVMCRLAAS